MPQTACRQMVALKIKELFWLPKRYTKEILESQRARDAGKPLIRNIVW